MSMTFPLPAVRSFSASVSDQDPVAASMPDATRQQEHICFYDFPSSPFCAKVRAMLRWKGLRFDTVDPLQPRHWWTLQRRGAGKVPALDIDGRFIVDSTDIADELDRLFAQAPLRPAGARAGALCHAVEEWADESLYFVGLHFLLLSARNEAPRVFGCGLAGRFADPFFRWRSNRQLRAQGTGRKTPTHVTSDLRRHLLHADALLADAPFVLGNTPWLCDFALFGQLAFLLRAPASAVLVRQHPRLVAFVDAICGMQRLGLLSR